MKSKVLMMVVLLAGLAATDTPSFAHHGGAAYDMSAPVVLKNAVVTEFVWINPHPLIKADYKDAKGEVQHWTTLRLALKAGNQIGEGEGGVNFSRCGGRRWHDGSPG